MSTGVKPRDEEHSFTRSDLEAIQDAMKNKKFRDLLGEYCEEIRDPANQALYQKEMTQLEKERGYDVTFINPKGSYVIKTSVAGDRKAFINICSNTNVGKPSYDIQEKNGQRGMNWQIPYSLIPPREDYDHKKERCVIYDVVFHPDTLRMAEANKQFRELVNKTAIDGLQKTYNIHLDSNNFRFPKSQYKGITIPAVIRKEDPNFKPPEEEETEDLSPDILEKLYPQRNYSETPTDTSKEPSNGHRNGKAKKMTTEFTHLTEHGYTLPKYVIKQQKNVDFQDYTYNKYSKQYSAIPSHIVVEINLPLLSSTKDCILDVQEKSLSLISEKPAKYKLNISLPYSVNEKCGHAKFDKMKHILIVTLPVIRNDNFINNNNNSKSLKIDNGVESEENSCSQSDEENNNRNLIVELSSITNNDAEISKPSKINLNCDAFLLQSHNYMLPAYTHNVLDNIIAFTFHVKNTEPQSVVVKHEDNKIYIKFTSIGSGFVPIHYAAIINFDEPINLDNVSGEAWDNNVILQLELNGDTPQKFQIGLSEKNMTYEYFDMTQVKKTSKTLDNPSKPSEVVLPVVEVTNSGTETNIVLSSKHIDYDDDDDDIESTVDEKEIVWTESNSTENGAKSILRKPFVMRSFSESSAGDIASSMDYISSDCIPEESSLKKTVRFNDVIAKQFYRYNSSIEGQKKKNQRKKSKKRNLERRKSESEAEDDSGNFTQTSKPRLKSDLKQRRDSGLADTSDAEAECKTSHHTTDGNDAKTDTEDDMPESVFKIYNNDGKAKQKTEIDIWESSDNKKVLNESQSINCENIQHNTDLYNPDRLNKGKYLEVSFKNDLIFDLDM